MELVAVVLALVDTGALTAGPTGTEGTTVRGSDGVVVWTTTGAAGAAVVVAGVPNSDDSQPCV